MPAPTGCSLIGSIWRSPHRSFPPEIIGTNVRVTIPVSSTGGEVLAVPAAALSATAAGDTILQVEDQDSTLRTVTVEPGLAAGGLVEVTPIEGDLAEGDWVVVGREGASSGSGGDDETGTTAPAETTDTTEPTETTDGEA